jgi:hypothetical protein
VVQSIVDAAHSDRAKLRLVWPKWKRILNQQQRDPSPDELPLGELA